MKPQIDTPVSHVDHSWMTQENTVFRPHDSPFKTAEKDVEIVAESEFGRVSLLSPNLMRLNSLCSRSSTK